MNEDIERTGVWDPETGLPGPELFRDRFRRAIARADRGRGMVALLCIHVESEEGPREVGARMTRCLRAVDSVARCEERRFAIIQTDLSHFDDAAFLAQKILDAIGNHGQGHVGIALYPDDSKDPDALYDIAMELAGMAKKRGQPYAFHAPALTATSRTHVDLARDLRNATGRNELAMVYQPKVDLRTGKICGVESLLRWHHPDRGLLWPEEFLHIAEESDLILPVGDWALRRACFEAALWRLPEDNTSRVAVNIAATQLIRPDFPELLKHLLADARLPAQRLEIELSERTVMHDPREFVTVLEALAEMGVEIAIDDFGTGYSSLSFLKLFPIATIKIDRSFIVGLPNDPFDAAIVRGVIGLGHGLRVQVVAEGVDNPSQLDFLRSEGCDQVQGHYFSPPLPAADCGRLIIEDGEFT